MHREEANLPSSLGPKAYPAVRDTACSSRNDDARALGGRQKRLYPRADARNEHVRKSNKGDAHEPKGYQLSANVREAGCSHQRLDGRDFLDALEKNSQNKERFLIIKVVV